MLRQICLFVFCCLFCFNARALSLISDEETESWLYDVLQPIFKTAELPLFRNNVHIVRDNSLNAFVGDKNHMFVHTGTLLKAHNSNEIEGVLAHETGHILGGHILRLKIKLQDMQKATLASLVAAAGAAAVSGRGDAAIAVVLGTQSSAINAITSYQMSEERAADESAVLLLSKNHKSVKGLKDFMNKIQSTNRLQGIEETIYFRTHPVTTERIAFFNEQLQKEKRTTGEYDLDRRLKRIQAKLFSYLAPLPKVLKKFPLEDNSSNAKLAHAIYYMRQKNIGEALKYIEGLIAEEPNNPYFYEIKAQMLFEGGRMKDAAMAYKKTLALKPQSDLFKLSYAEAVLNAEPSRQELNSLIPLLEQANRYKSYPVAYHYLGQIYANLGEMAIADYYSAEYSHAIGEQDRARKILHRILKQPLRSDIKLRAEDLAEKIKNDYKKTSLF